jgi:hypothetical protein
MNNFDVHDSLAAAGMPSPTLDSIEADLVSLVTLGRRIHTKETYNARVDNLQQRIRELSPIMRELLVSRFDMGVRI